MAILTGRYTIDELLTMHNNNGEFASLSRER